MSVKRGPPSPGHDTAREAVYADAAQCPRHPPRPAFNTMARWPRRARPGLRDAPPRRPRRRTRPSSPDVSARSRTGPGKTRSAWQRVRVPGRSRTLQRPRRPLRSSFIDRRVDAGGWRSQERRACSCSPVCAGFARPRSRPASPRASQPRPRTPGRDRHHRRPARRFIRLTEVHGPRAPVSMRRPRDGGASVTRTTWARITRPAGACRTRVRICER